jgi:hypothetical protein
MNASNTGLPADRDLRASADALRRAALQARELARQTGTGIAVDHQGAVVVLSPAELDRRDANSATSAAE